MVYIEPAPQVGQSAGDATGSSVPVPSVRLMTPTLTDGRMVAEWLPGDLPAAITRVTVSAQTDCAAYVFVGGLAQANLVSGTSSGRFDENDCNSPIAVPPGDRVYLVWETTTPGCVGRLEYTS